MANMYPNNIAEYMPTDSERIVYQELKNQLPDSYDVFYSVNWTTYEKGSLVKSEADFIVVAPEYGFLCLEVKGGSGIRVEDNKWYIQDSIHGERKLKISPYDQAEKSMYYFFNTFSNKYNNKYQGIFGSGVVFPFYAVNESMNLDNRHRTCTVDCNDLNDLYNKIKKMFKLWGGKAFGRSYYSKSQNDAFLELIRERIAIEAAAGALVKYKEQQLDVINRVQDNYIYLLSNYRQFYVRGGAGTGKTWIAMKMAKEESAQNGRKVLFLCASIQLAEEIKKQIGTSVEVRDTNSLFQMIIDDYCSFAAPVYNGLSKHIKKDVPRYDAIFVDEAQDFCKEWAKVVKKLLRDEQQSRFGIFYDDVQVLRENSFSDGFGIESPPYLLHENIRNTANIYYWTSNKTNLGKDVIANPVEGPTPQTELIYEHRQLTLLLETILKKYLVDEHLPNSSITILSDNLELFMETYEDGIAKWTMVNRKPSFENEISVFSVFEYKGLESDMVIYIHGESASDNMNYIAYTRAKYYLIELVRKY